MTPREMLAVLAEADARRMVTAAIEGERRRAGSRAVVVDRVLLPEPWTETVKVVGDRALVCYENPATSEYLPYPADGRSVEEVRAAFVRDLLEGSSEEHD